MSFITLNLVTMLYLVASVCFIQALKGLSSPATARKGNAFGKLGMMIAFVTTIALIMRLKIDASTQWRRSRVPAAWASSWWRWACWSAAALARSSPSASR
jgi:NAD(P) transhydrogenase subunit beta